MPTIYELNQSILNKILDADMKVFAMNECDKVAAVSKERAVQFYAKETGVTVEEMEEYVEEVDKYKNKMYYPVTELTSGELTAYVKDETVLTYYGGMLGVLIPYDVVIKKERKIYPYIISSTEY